MPCHALPYLAMLYNALSHRVILCLVCHVLPCLVIPCQRRANDIKTFPVELSFVKSIKQRASLAVKIERVNRELDKVERLGPAVLQPAYSLSFPIAAQKQQLVPQNSCRIGHGGGRPSPARRRPRCQAKGTASCGSQGPPCSGCTCCHDWTQHAVAFVQAQLKRLLNQPVLASSRRGYTSGGSVKDQMLGKVGCNSFRTSPIAT